MIHWQQLPRFILLSVILLSSPHFLKGDPGQPPGKNVLFNKETHLSLAYSSKYVWRGLDLVDGPVIQPECALSKWGFNLEAWGNMNAGSVHNRPGKFSEVDLIFNYADSLTFQNYAYSPDFQEIGIDYSLGTCGYFYPTGLSPHTWELYFAVRLDTSFAPAIAFYYDVDKVKGWYISYEFRQTWERLFCPCQDFEGGIGIAASAGWGSSAYNDFYYAYDEASFLDILFTLSLPAKFKGWEITPLFSASFLPNRNIRHLVYPNTNYWGGAILSKSF